MLHRYHVTLRLKDAERLLPYHLDEIGLEIDADSLVDACEKAEVYLSGVFGAAFTVCASYVVDPPINWDLGAPGDDIEKD